MRVGIFIQPKMNATPGRRHSKNTIVNLNFSAHESPARTGRLAG
jgi:hypothetical protein